MPSYIDFTDEQLSKMKEMYVSGKNTTQISEVFGICRTSVTSRLIKMGCVIRRVGIISKTNENALEKVKSLRSSGFSWREISAEMKISESSLQKAVRRNNIDLNLSKINSVDNK